MSEVFLGVRSILAPYLMVDHLCSIRNHGMLDLVRMRRMQVEQMIADCKRVKLLSRHATQD